jgi:hypothetical protein
VCDLLGDDQVLGVHGHREPRPGVEVPAQGRGFDGPDEVRLPRAVAQVPAPLQYSDDDVGHDVFGLTGADDRLREA